MSEKEKVRYISTLGPAQKRSHHIGSQYTGGLRCITHTTPISPVSPTLTREGYATSLLSADPFPLVLRGTEQLDAPDPHPGGQLQLASGLYHISRSPISVGYLQMGSGGSRY